MSIYVSIRQRIKCIKEKMLKTLQRESWERKWCHNSLSAPLCSAFDIHLPINPSKALRSGFIICNLPARKFRGIRSLSKVPPWGQWFSTWASESPGRLVQAQIDGSTSRVSDSVCVGWGPRMCISSKSLGNADAVPQGTTVVDLLDQNSVNLNHAVSGFPSWSWLQVLQWAVALSLLMEPSISITLCRQRLPWLPQAEISSPLTGSGCG